jgi:hypothetical protein
MNLAPEFHLFCLTLRQPLTPDDAAALRAALAAGPDWDAILAGARRHRVAPLVLAGLQACGTNLVPPPVVEELRLQTLAAAQRNLAQVAELGRLMHAFAGAGVPVLALKGVALAAQIHGNTFPRGARDIDLLVELDRFAAADAVLSIAGYRRAEHAQTPRQRAVYRRTLKDLLYIHEATGVQVELHHRLADNPNLLAADVGALWNERAEVRVGNAMVPTMPRRKLPLYLMVHGAGHGWERLLWLVDLAAELREAAAVESALSAADAAGLGAAMRHAIMLSHDWLGVPVAAPHLADVRSNAKVARLDRLLANLYAGSEWHRSPRRGSLQGLRRYSLWQRLYRLSLKSDWRYLASQAKREWFTPVDWDTVRLPDALFFLYPFVRPVGWLARRWRR